MLNLGTSIICYIFLLNFCLFLFLALLFLPMFMFMFYDFVDLLILTYLQSLQCSLIMGKITIYCLELKCEPSVGMDKLLGALHGSPLLGRLPRVQSSASTDSAVHSMYTHRYYNDLLLQPARHQYIQYIIIYTLLYTKIHYITQKNGTKVGANAVFLTKVLSIYTYNKKVIYLLI